MMRSVCSVRTGMTSWHDMCRHESVYRIVAGNLIQNSATCENNIKMDLNDKGYEQLQN